MLELRRTVRININPSQPQGLTSTGNGSAATPPPDRCPNGFAGKPSSRGLARYYEIDVLCRGNADPKTGYLMNIHQIDSAVRDLLVPRLNLACQERPWTDPARLLPELITGLDDRLGGIAHAVQWRLNPYFSVAMLTSTAPRAEDRNMTSTQPLESAPVVYLRQRFDFAASHRLNVPELSEAENRRIFGKCNNPSYHGHNYQFEPCVALRLDDPATPDSPTTFGLPEIEQIADREIVEAFDHLNLNVDTTEFAEGSGLNPSVENIARVFFDRMAPAVRAACDRAELVAMTVWETDRTSCTYPGTPPV